MDEFRGEPMSQASSSSFHSFAPIGVFGGGSVVFGFRRGCAFAHHVFGRSNASATRHVTRSFRIRDGDGRSINVGCS